MKHTSSAVGLLLALSAGIAGCGIGGSQGSHTASPSTHSHHHAKTPHAAANIPWGASRASKILPGDVLIADAGSNRILLVTPQKKIVWQYPKPGQPSKLHDNDDVFFGPHFDEIITNQEGYNVVSILNFKTRKIVWNYGHGGVPGSQPGYLNTPDDAFLYQTPKGDEITVADIKNQRILFISRKSHRIIKQYGQTGVMAINPPTTYSAPNGDFPAPNGGMLVTQINGNDAILLNRNNQVQYTVHFPSKFYYPSDANFTPHGNIIVAFYTNPGAIVEMSPSGRVLWTYYVTQGPGKLNQPSLAVKLSNGMVLLNDDHNDRVIVINPKTNQIVWQYGHTGVPGTAPGYLNIPDGLDVLPAGVTPGGKNGIGGHLWSYPGNGL
ncbi:hypothetical protein [Sulfobacillus harzensis]|uniref:Uncharacterized protein n=1 Tax=Sulfobacillus harzensis TaxID=2729629 RepID=A0A7Y0L2S3_9FIRM|nr:hypothetical protein [Sulfobacillus harzensis]NMP21937.1 hypothetical protein [Sulfobacillus harzensis]